MSTLPSLPPELRLQIYHHLLTPAAHPPPSRPHPIWHHLTLGFQSSIPTSTLLLSHLIHSELLPLLYAPTNPFTICPELAFPAPPISTATLTVVALAQHPSRALIADFHIAFSMRMPTPALDASMRKAITGAAQLRDAVALLARGPVRTLRVTVYVYQRASRPGRELGPEALGVREVFGPLEGRLRAGAVRVERWRPEPDPTLRRGKYAPELREWLRRAESDPVEFEQLRELVTRRAGESQRDGG